MNHNWIVMSIWMFMVSYFAVSLILPENTPFHLNKVYMALQMVGAMNILEFLLMKKYIWTVIAILFTLIITYMLRNQTYITETEFLKGMIEHHQMALLMANGVLTKKSITPFTNKLASNIITGQQTEINDMLNQLRS